MSQDMHSEPEVSDFARTALTVFAELGVFVTWCHTYPGGLDPELVPAIEAAGHEQAFHYNAVPDADITSWGWQQMKAQYAWAQALTGREDLITNKNHFTRWEGWHEFFLWCERLAIQIDQSRGGSKQGNFGFTFGTSHVHFPIADAAHRNRRIDVLELPLHTQDLARHAHPAAGAVILDQALAEHGVAPFLYHARWLHLSEDVRDCCRRTVQGARDRGMPWWTARQLNDWERKRRGVHLAARAEPDGALIIDVYSREPVRDAAILVAPSGLAANVRYATSMHTPAAHASTTPRVGVVRRHGRRFVEIAVDLPSGQSTLTCTPAGVSLSARAVV